jgi:hypothetical protein
VIRLLFIAAFLFTSVAQAEITFEEEEPEAAPSPEPEKKKPAEEKKPETWSPPQVDFRLVSRLAVDTSFDGGGENVASLYRFAVASIRTEKGATRLKLSARLRWVTTTEAPIPKNRRSAFEPMFGESSISTTKWGIDWSAGFLDVVWGQNPAFAPADVLTPLDTRDGPLPTTDARLATPAVRAKGKLGEIRWDAVWLPVHLPNRVPLIGNDWSPFPLVASSALPNPASYIDPTLYPLLESNPTATKLPHADLTAPQGGLRLSTRAGAFDFGLSWAEFYDRQPRLQISAEFSRFLKAMQGEDISEQFLAAGAFQSSLQAGKAPFTATYQRTRVFAVDSAWQKDRLRITLDAGYSPMRVFPKRNLTSTVHPMVSGVLGFEWEGPPIIAAGLYSMAALHVRQDEQLLYLESPRSEASADRTVSLSLGYLTAQHRFLDERLQVQLTGMVTQHLDFFAQPRVGWRYRDAHTFTLGALFVGGRGVLGTAYRRNSEAYVEYALAL